MTLPALLDGLSEISGALRSDARGRITEATSPEAAARDAGATASATIELTAAGAAAGLKRLELVLVKGTSTATVTAVRPDELLLVVVDPSRGTAQVERVLHGWVVAATAGAAAAAPPPATPAPAAASRGSPAAHRGGQAPSAPGGSASAAPPVPARSAAPEDPWAGLRRSLVRGLLTEAATRRRELAEAAPVTGRAGAEPVAAAELEGAMQALLQGIGSVLAGDGIGAARTLEGLAAASQQNLSFRWLALYWSGRAALRSGNTAAARGHLKQALLVAKQLDLYAVAASQWVAGEVLAHDGDHARALAYLAQARAGFQRLADRWGLGQAWLAEARTLVASGREDEGIAAARQAWAADPAWEEPPVFLARRALVRDDLGEAEGMLRHVSGPPAERLRSLMDAVREKILNQADASEFLRESEAPPSARSIRAMERIAQAAPRFVQAREALAWMLLKVGKYAEASTIFRALLAQQLTQADRASVMLGLGCIAHAQQTGKDPGARLDAAAASAARSSQLGGGGAVFSGQLSVFALPDVVEFVRSARRTGLLVCSSENGMAAVHFRDGRITGARSPRTPSLGEVLLGAKKISSVALRALRAPQEADQPDHVLGDLLIREGLVDASAVQEAVRRQVELTLLDLVRWKDGEFAFNREGEGEAAATQPAIELDAQDVLLNVFRQMDEDARGDSASGAHP